MNYVIGSGPAGVSAASALLSRGLSVTLLDAGAELESGLQEKSDDLGRRLSETWHEDERTVLRGALRYTSEGAPLKLRYGSDYAYRDAGDHQPMTKSRVEAYRSFAMGGLSALWGASVLPYNQDDLADWPISQDELKSHYAAVLNLTGLSAERDELSSVYPLFIDPTASLNSSRQAQALLTRMRSHATDLARAHFHFGKSRLAITRSLGAAAACEHCGLCLYGCPYGFIYTSQETLRDMMRNSNRFTYVPGYLVQSLRESGGTVEINAVSIATGESAVFESSRVYLAAGVFSSTRILLESLKAYDRPVTMTQSENFLLPLLMTQSFSGVASERLHTLSQVFLELNDRSISTHSIHLQVYTYNDFYFRMAKDKLGVFYPLFAPFLKKAVERTILIRGYLHSDDSSAITARLQRADSGFGKSVLHLAATDNKNTRPAIRAVSRALARNWKNIGAYPLRPAMRLGAAGSGAHVGGSFPMRRQPGDFETDRAGRPSGFTRVHVVDSTVFPTVPAATITLSAMANAHRIASIPEAEFSGQSPA